MFTTRQGVAARWWVSTGRALQVSAAVMVFLLLLLGFFVCFFFFFVFCFWFFFSEWLFTLLSPASKMPVCIGALGTCRTEGFMVPNAKIPQPAKSLLQASLGVRKSCLLPAAQPGGGHRCQLCCPQPPTNSSGKSLSSKNLPWNLPAMISPAIRTQNDSS